MATRETFTQNTLTIELTHSENEVRLDWRGKSNDRQPDAFLVPVMRRALEDSDGGRLPVVLDFSAMEYMNSSTFAPLVRMLDQVARGKWRVRLEYDGARRWQMLNFAALKAFETADGRVSVHAK
jgi:hypothetical protein